MSECDHSWLKLTVMIDCLMIGADGERTPIPDFASCHVCGETWYLDADDSTAAHAVLDGLRVTGRRHPSLGTPGGNPDKERGSSPSG